MSASPIIRVEDLRKEFRRPRQFAGRLGGLRTLVTRQHTVLPAVPWTLLDDRWIARNRVSVVEVDQRANNEYRWLRDAALAIAAGVPEQ